MDIFKNMFYAMEVTCPILIVLLLGMFLRQKEILTETLIASTNKLVFQVAIPAFLFLAISAKPITETFDSALIGYGIVFTVLAASVTWLLAPVLAKNEHPGVFTQNVFRSNMGIFGLALSFNAFGEAALAQAGVYLAVLTVLYNVLSVLMLSRSMSQKALKTVLTNPLIVGCLLGLLFSAKQWSLPGIIAKSLAYLADIALPMALLCIGGSLTLGSLNSLPKAVLTATVGRLLLLPLMAVLCAVALGFRGVELGILFFMMAAPTASVAFVMAQQMTADAASTAQVIAVSTLLAPITIAIGLSLLTTLSLV
jgi:predicted permease